MRYRHDPAFRRQFLKMPPRRNLVAAVLHPVVRLLRKFGRLQTFPRPFQRRAELVQIGCRPALAAGHMKRHALALHHKPRRRPIHQRVVDIVRRRLAVRMGWVLIEPKLSENVFAPLPQAAISDSILTHPALATMCNAARHNTCCSRVATNPGNSFFIASEALPATLYNATAQSTAA